MISTENLIKNIDSHITVHMRTTGKTQEDVARELGMSSVQFSRKRRGVDNAVWRLDEVIDICDILKMPPSELLEEPFPIRQ